jgi:Co/Zn/Cd efflux system component
MHILAFLGRPGLEWAERGQRMMGLVGLSALLVNLLAAFPLRLGSTWPDLIAAFAIAGLDLHSAWSIIRAARADLSDR